MANGAGQFISSSACFIRLNLGFAAVFHHLMEIEKIIVYKNMCSCVLFAVFVFAESEARKALP
ncbi:hypothetical protein [Pseudomonas bijieensis]|uniref:Uncharacterized protein n=1 Tax=Pseudomonas bijieensis TaxID=2681983 RepID=A0A6N1CLH0_9PSED|nr:hypothetical protein [Pseudomonas bijieensis]QKS85236.1 hypothetical protein GN234_26305 [Pseudomonas bijieensis]